MKPFIWAGKAVKERSTDMNLGLKGMKVVITEGHLVRIAAI